MEEEEKNGEKTKEEESERERERERIRKTREALLNRSIQNHTYTQFSTLIFVWLSRVSQLFAFLLLLLDFI